MNTPQQLHIPVLLADTIKLLDPQLGDNYLDLTAGYGGHARRVISSIGSTKQAVLCDRDSFALSNLSDLQQAGATLIHSDYLSASQRLVDSGSHFSMILLDLGVSSPQLDRSDRGFSFVHNGPLDMRMDQDQELTAADVINRYSEKDIIRVLEEYGDINPRRSARIARAIVIRRSKRPFDTTDDLAENIRLTVGEMDHGKYHKTHPATQAFQAIRIEVNDEMGQLIGTLPLLNKLLNPGGRLAIISFHSIEDRIVKNFFRDNADGLDSPMVILTKKPVKGDVNDVHNPRARSAKLRAVVKK